MFECKECKAKYETKPDFCECGNDEFVEIADEIREPEIRHKTPDGNKDAREQERVAHPSSNDKFNEIGSAENFFYGLKTNILKNPGEVVSYVILAICLILSAFTVFFIELPSSVGNNPESKPQIKVLPDKSVNDINSIWVEKKFEPENKNKTDKKMPTASKSPETAVKLSVAPAARSVKPTKKTTKPVKTSVKSSTTPSKSSKPPGTASLPQKTVPVSAPAKTTQSVTTPKKTTAVTGMSAASLQNYKNSLRRQLFSKIDFTKIDGNGHCEVTFTINSSGKLTGRKFSKQSGNILLDDAVYKAMKSVPTFNPPPVTYRGETMTFSVKFENGRYEVNLR